jgi:hypothetical protein
MIKDDLAKHQLGYSFLQELTNQLQSSFKTLSQQAFSKTERAFALRGKGQEQAILYLKQCNNIVALLFSSIHVSSRMPARGEEICILRWADTAAV